MKVYLDDDLVHRHPPDSTWVRCQTARQAIDLLKTGMVKAISLDHDLGPVDEVGTGYQVACYLEKMAYNGNPIPEVITIHSANPVGRKNMERAILNARKLEGKSK